MFKNIAEKIFIINLKERSDRRKEIAAELKKINISEEEYEFFEAVRPIEKGEFRTIGAKGCFMSHLGVLKEAKRRGLKNVVILEDDVAFRKYTIKNINAILEKLNKSVSEYDILYLGHGEKEKEENIVKIKHDRPIMLSHFVFFNQRVYDKLIDFLEKLIDENDKNKKYGPMDVDGAYTTFRYEEKENIKTGLYFPNLAFQRPSNSDITGENKKPNFIKIVLRKIKLFIKRRR